ncbi:MAG TPA: DNA polymerase III subunit gamma/tau [Syntrophorhabdaceae bacterium]|nr:DNA polymerase III subunit gamma/tau [Syntrophorhabdaceae bacterium]
MAYTVIARRWRPKRFEDVVGQTHITTTIKNSIKSNRIAHAYLFTGPRGVGKTSLARIFAKALNCKDGPREEPCGVCENCKSIDNNSFVDIIEIDAASARKIEDIRELTETVKYMPMRGKYKVYILDEAHMLTTEARNAFLKTLEEPPGHNIFILATTEVHKIPYTIMSRCQRFDFKRITEKDIVEQLKRICDAEGIGYEVTAFEHIAAEADGSLRDAESLLDQIISYCGDYIHERDVINIIGIIEKDVIYRIVESIFKNNIKKGFEELEAIIDEGYDITQIYNGIVSFFRNLMLIKACGEIPSFVSLGENERERFLDLAGLIDYVMLQEILNELFTASDNLKGPFARLSLEILFINLFNKINRLEKKEEAVKEAYNTHEIYKSQKRIEADKEDLYEEGLKNTKDLKGFIRYAKEKKPFIGAMFENIKLLMEEDIIKIFLDGNHTFVKEDKNTKDDIKRLACDFFKRDIEIMFFEPQEKKNEDIYDYVKEAESIFSS